jgi:hypothetical protein
MSSPSDRRVKQLSSLQPYMTKKINKSDFNEKFYISIIPKGTVLYQGTDFDFNKLKTKFKSKALSHSSELSEIKEIKINDEIVKSEYYKYYDSRHRGSYFLSSRKTADIYGLDKDYTTIIYSSLPNLSDIYNPTNQVKYIYPLYYIPKIGFTIEYETNKNLYLLDIGNLDNIQMLFNLIDKLKISDKLKDDFKYYLHITCSYDYDDNYDFDNPPKKINRHSDKDGDDILVELFKAVNKYLSDNKTATIDGWIHYKTSKFHDEILIISNNSLTFKKIFTRKLPIDNHGIPTYEKYMQQYNNKKIKYDVKSKKNNILHNYVIPNI